MNLENFNKKLLKLKIFNSKQMQLFKVHVY